MPTVGELGVELGAVFAGDFDAGPGGNGEWEFIGFQIPSDLEPRLESLDQVEMKDLRILAATFAEGGRDGGPADFGIEIEGLEGQAANLGFSESRPDGYLVDHRPIRSGDAFDRWPVLGGFDQELDLFGREWASIVAAVGLHIQPGEMGDWIAEDPSLAFEPFGKVLD